jgi:hypothetical protein
MKPRHAAALALVGWYLMVPPMMHEKDWPQRGRHTTSLSEWFVWNSARVRGCRPDEKCSFETADACAKARSALIARGSKGALNGYHRWLAGRAPSKGLLDEWASTYSISSAIKDQYGQSLCIANDDPRLSACCVHELKLSQ